MSGGDGGERPVVRPRAVEVQLWGTAADGTGMRVDALATALARSADVRGASWAAVEHLGAPHLSPSVYVERGGRLRCQALRGYRQLLDGMPPWAGVIGRAYATGESIVVPDIRAEPAYMAAADGIVAEVCHPLVCGNRTVGALNVESTQHFAPDELERIAATALALGMKIEALGGPQPESASQRLVRHAITLATQYDVAAIERAVLTAAGDITPLASALLLRRGGAGLHFGAARAHGPLGPSLYAIPNDAITALASLTSAGCSVYTVAGVPAPEAGSAGAPVAEVGPTTALRSAGAESMAVLPVGPDRILIVADEVPIVLTTEHCELLELLAAQASACLRTAASVSALRTEAATDALTGLGHHATFHAELAEARASGEIGVLVIDLDFFKEFNDEHGHPAGDRALRAASAALTSALRRGDALFRIGGDEFAALLPGVDGEMAVEVAHRLHRAVAEAGIGLSVSIGAAVARHDEDEDSVLGRADRALYAVKGAGRNGVALDRGGDTP